MIKLKTKVMEVTENEVKARDLTYIINSDVLKKAVQENKEIERLHKDSFKKLDIARDAFIHVLRKVL